MKLPSIVKPNSETALYLRNYFTANSLFPLTKSIQKNFKFLVDWDIGFLVELQKNNVFLRPWHILKIDFPTSYGWKAEVMKIGPYSYSWPVMNHDGFDISITFEEDDISTIGYLIHYLQYKIIGDIGNPMNPTGDKANGNYNSQSKNRIKFININIYDDMGNVVRNVIFKDIFFVGATPISLDYDGSDSIKYTVSFHCDLMEQKFPKITP